MRIRDKRSYLVYAQRSSDVPLTLHLLDTSGKTVLSVDVPSSGAKITVPVGMTVEFNSADGQKPSMAQINGADVNTAAIVGLIGNGGYMLTTHPSVGDFVLFVQ